MPKCGCWCCIGALYPSFNILNIMKHVLNIMKNNSPAFLRKKKKSGFVQ
jgi:hypothetical protein